MLLFGAGGQVGRAVRRAADGEIALTALDRDEADFADPAACAAQVAARRPDVVINAAAYTAVDRAESEPDLAHAVNATAPGVIAQACAAAGVPFLHVSTDYVFDGAEGAPRREDDRVAPLNVYGRTKRAGEIAVAAAGGPHVVLRTASVFSADGANFVRTMLRLGAERDRLTVVDDQIMGPTPAAAIAAALLTIAKAFAAGRGASGLFHFAGAPPVSWCGFARAIFAASARARTPVVEPIPSEAWPTPAARPRHAVLDCSRIAAAYGVAQPDWRAGLRDVLVTLGERDA